MRSRLFVALTGFLMMGAACVFAAPVHVQVGDNVVFLAVDSAAVLNPDLANDVQNSVPVGSPESPARIWEAVSASGSRSGVVLESPPNPHRQQNTASLQETVAEYEVQFSAAGTYRLYVRAANNGTPADGTSDSIWLPTTISEADPSTNFSLPNSGNFEWKGGPSYTISSGETGAPLLFHVGARECEARLDAFVFSTNASLSSGELDALFAGTPTVTPTPIPSGDFYVTDVDEFNSALAMAEPGDVIVMANGEWSDVEIVFDGKRSKNGSGGTSGAPITLRAESGGLVHLTGESLLRIAGQYLVVDGLVFRDGFSDSNDVITFRQSSSNLANNCRLTNCAIIGYNPVDPATSYRWVSIYGVNNRVDHCRFEGMNHAGVQLVVWPAAGGPPSATRIDNNHFVDRAPGTGNGFETIRIGTSDVSMEVTNAIVEHNLFERCDGEIEIISNKSVGNIYRCNTFRESDGMLTLRHGTDCVVEGNFFFGAGVDGSGGIRIIGPRHVVINNYLQDLEGTDFRAAISIMNGVPNSPLNRYLQAVDCVIAFNTVVNCRQGFATGIESSEGDTTLAPDRITFANNVMLSDGDAHIYYENAPLSITYEGNFAFGGPLGIPAPPSGISLVDPELSPSTGGIWRPSPSGPIPGSAVGSYPMVTADIEGQVRDASPDSGADEIATGIITCGPLFAEDVGPLWSRNSSVAMDLWAVE